MTISPAKFVQDIGKKWTKIYALQTSGVAGYVRGDMFVAHVFAELAHNWRHAENPDVVAIYAAARDYADQHLSY